MSTTGSKNGYLNLNFLLLYSKKLLWCEFGGAKKIKKVFNMIVIMKNVSVKDFERNYSVRFETEVKQISLKVLQ